MPVGGWDDPTKHTAPTVPPQLQPQPRPQYVYAQPATTHYLTCKVCDRGMLVPKKIFRLSTPVVAIGFILLIPSVIGMLISALMLLGSVISGAATTAAVSPRVRQEASTGMQEAGVPRRVINDVLTGRTDRVDQWINADMDTNGRVTANEVEVVRQAQQDLKGSVPRLSVYGLMSPVLGVSSILFGLASFVCGLFGWLLVMRKRVLQCQLCGAVVNAS